MTGYRVRYQTIEFGEIDIHVRTLRNRQEYSDDDGVAEKLGVPPSFWPIFGLVWPSSIVLTHFLLSYPYQNKRILEVGCGIGLASLMLNHLKADITATDIHPEAEQFLLENVNLNKEKVIPFLRCGWDNLTSDLGEFDLIIGSDLLYEDENIELLSNFIDQHSKQECDVILLDPGRGRHAKFSKKMTTLGFSNHKERPISPECLEKPFKGFLIQYNRLAL